METGYYAHSCVAVYHEARAAKHRNPWWVVGELYGAAISPNMSGMLFQSDFGPPWSDSARNHRIMALCMAAAIAESKGF